MIYILEDDDNIRKLINYSLTSQGIEVKEFALPSDFWTALENNKPDLLLLTVKEFDLLALLIKNRGNVLTRELLLEHIWDFSADVESRTISALF